MKKVNDVRRRLLKIGVYTAPVLVCLGKVSGARASGSVVPKKRSRDKSCTWLDKLFDIDHC